MAHTSTAISPPATPGAPQQACIRRHSSEAGTLAHAHYLTRKFDRCVTQQARPVRPDAPHTRETLPLQRPQSSAQSPNLAARKLRVPPTPPETAAVRSDACDFGAA